ncbi:MAG: Na+/Ca+ antiporter, CaCA family [Candidatus Gottesmanbacteria bacterium GW2011_GWA2_47_9]|uniref:Na+/Ca+ antiporter, CaCA family n=1 Tax=Candidatus Gottesmanbacteria bacterium GW2011_GWA2_47_9 TaxID=1618445 RepID=A0A0G1TZY4_9BACT|nr:MAG: Na+/Ca+ antiporter, CaCA family [Candidatus Gottesmanbacteria bacterium GW2011_GWA2_47_9]
MIPVNVAILIVFGIVLAVSARLVVHAAEDIARQMGLPTFIIGFFVLGMLTSTPEFFVMLQAAADGFPDLVFAAAVVASPVAALRDGNLSRVDGLLLVGFYLLYVIFVSDEEKLAKRVAKRANHAKHMATLLGMLLAGVIGMVIASKIVVESAEILMSAFHIPALVFGLFFLSVGTNLPEFSLAFQAIARGRRDIAFGDFLGSSVANTFILGVLGILAPFQTTSYEGMMFTIMLLLGVSLFFIWAAKSKQSISRQEGLGLLIFYGLFVVYQLFLAA